MEQLDFFPIPNPCRGVCRMNERGYCLGCWRRRDERFEWLSFSEARKANIVRLALQRKRIAEYKQARLIREKNVITTVSQTQFLLFGDSKA